MAWLNPWEDDWETFASNHTTRRWPSPNEPRRFSPYWYPMWLQSVTPLMDFYLLRTTIDENPLKVLWSSIQTHPLDERRFGGDTGVSPDGRLISVEVERFDDPIPGFQFPGYRWRWRYSREGFADTVVADVALVNTKDPPEGFVHDFDLPRQSSYAFSLVFSNDNWTPQLDTDYSNPALPKAWHWQAVAARIPVPNNP